MAYALCDEHAFHICSRCGEIGGGIGIERGAIE